MGREQGRSLLSSDTSLCPSIPPAQGPQLRGSQSQYLCLQMGASWEEGQGGPRAFGIRPSALSWSHPTSSSCRGPQDLGSHLGRAGQERNDGPLVSTYCVPGAGLGSAQIVSCILARARPLGGGGPGNRCRRWSEGSCTRARVGPEARAVPLPSWCPGRGLGRHPRRL